MNGASASKPPRRVLIITGAGASVSLGANGVPIPMMPMWAGRLVESLGWRAQQIGLRADMPGDEFEETLGRFLNFEATLPIVQPFLHLGSPMHNHMGANMEVLNWYNQAAGAVADIRRQIWANLFENFGLARVDTQAAARSYRNLHELIRASDDGGAESFLSHATTNYDTAIEAAIEDDEHLRLIDGFAPRPGKGGEIYSPNLLVTQSLSTTESVPVLHIHGAVGWYFRRDGSGSVMRRPSDDSFDDRETPALLLPDSTKNPDVLSSQIRDTWDAFRGLLREASHVLFLGHSLHDPHIIRQVQSADKPTAVVVLSALDASGRFAGVSDRDADYVASQLPKATAVAGRFGQLADWPDLDATTLDRWLLRTTPTSTT